MTLLLFARAVLTGLLAAYSAVCVICGLQLMADVRQDRLGYPPSWWLTRGRRAWRVGAVMAMTGVLLAAAASWSALSMW